MPIFNFKCAQCGKQSELLLPRFDSNAVCPACGTSDMKKLPAVFAAVVKSGGAKHCAGKDSCPAADTHMCGGGCCHGGH